jgi:hypothetical protein
MKIWHGYGSEHSYRLVLIGHFQSEEAAAEVEGQIARLQEEVPGFPEADWETRTGRFSDELLNLLEEIKVWDLSRAEIQAMLYDFSVERDGMQIRITGDDGDIQGFVKMMIGRSARVEIYSAHDWTDEGEPVVRETEEPDEAEAEAGEAGTEVPGED